MNAKNNSIGILHALVWLSVAALLSACSDSDSDSDNPPLADDPAATVDATAFKATVYRTEGGIPHIKAEDFGSLGFGTGYAAAQDNFCILARNLLKYRAQLSEFLGPDDGNLDTDLFYKYLIETGQYNADISPELDAMFVGYAAGFNRYLRDTGIDNLPDPECRDAQWIQQMSAEDVRRIHLTPAFLPNLARLFLAAAPPAMTASAGFKETAPIPNKQITAQHARANKTQTSAKPAKETQAATVPQSEKEKRQLMAAINAMVTARDKGSNGVAIGRDLTAHDGGILYTNPHLDWGLQFRFYPMHQIIPGVTNLLGANTFERANVGFGTNGDIAWTNTVTAARTSALYELELAPGNPLAYMFDGEVEDIEQIEVSVNVLGSDGQLSEESHTFYKSRHGLLMGLIFSWDTSTAFALRIADEGARGQNGGAIAFSRAKTVRELRTALNQFQSSPNTNTVATDRSGEALYANVGPVANLTDQQLTDCASPTPVSISFFAPAFLGNTSACEWNTDPDSAAPGLLGASKQATLIRTDYVTNSNDSYWLANPDQPITGIPLVQGSIDSERTLRTRSGLRMVQERIDGSDGLSGNIFDIDSLLDRMLSNQNLAGQLLRDDLVTLCNNNPSVTVDGSAIDISAACPVLAAWNLKSDLDSRGAHLFREFLREAGASGRTLPESLNYAVPFNVGDPINTPRGLDTSDNPNALQALAKAVSKLTEAGIALDAQLGDIQSITRNGEVIPLHGGEEFEGVFNKMSLAFDGANGYPDVTDSSGTWIMATEFTADGPVTKAILTYSLSANTESPHYSDMSKLFSSKQFVDLPFAEEEVVAAAMSTLEITEDTEQCAGDGWQAFAQPAFDSETACRDYFSEIEAQQITDFVAAQE